MISLRARLIRFITGWFFRRMNADGDVVAVRRILARIQFFSRLARRVVASEETINGVRCKWLVPRGCDREGVLFYLHGGAYLVGSPESHARMVSFIARTAGMRAVLPDYSLAPENPFPAGLHDCIAAYRGLLASGIAGKDIIIGGDSAGGGMSVATLLSLRDAGEELPRAALLLSPWLDLTASGESIVSRADVEPWFRPQDMRTVARRYRPSGDLRNPLVSPLFADVAGLPPAFTQVGDHEILLSDAERLAAKMRAAGIDAQLQVWPEMWHVFQFFIGKMPESRRAIDEIAAFLVDKSRQTAGS